MNVKYLEKIVLEDEIEICEDIAGYCREIDRYILKRVVKYVAEYYDFRFLTEEQFVYLKNHEMELKEERDAYYSVLQSFKLKNYCDGSEYIRSYACSQRFRAPETPLESCWDGPYIYDGESLCFLFSTNDSYYAVAPKDYTAHNIFLAGGDGSEFYTKRGFSLYHYDGMKGFYFWGKQISIKDFETDEVSELNVDKFIDDIMEDAYPDD